MNNIDKPLAILTKEKRERTQINEIKNEKEDIRTDTTEIQGLIKGYYEQLYANILYNLEEMEKFFTTYNLPRLKKEEIESQNRPINSKEIESVIKTLSMK